MAPKKTIISEMQIVEDALEAEKRKVELIENKLRKKLLTIEQRNKLEAELEDVRKLLSNNQKSLTDLRHENTRSFMIATSFVFACFLLFGLYSTIFGGI